MKTINNFIHKEIDMRDMIIKVKDTVVEFVSALMAFVKNLFGYYTRTGLNGYMEHKNVMISTVSMLWF